jgi:hypothetical protein
VGKIPFERLKKILVMEKYIYSINVYLFEIQAKNISPQNFSAFPDGTFDPSSRPSNSPPTAAAAADFFAHWPCLMDVRAIGVLPERGWMDTDLPKREQRRARQSRWMDRFMVK